MYKLTKLIFNLSAPYNNPYEGNKTKLLFVCSVGLLRSPTLADVATKLGFNARSCGTSKGALIPLSANLIAWADKIIFVNKENYDEAKATFEAAGYMEDIEPKKVILGIEDDYERDHPRLVQIAETWLNHLK